MTYKWAHPWLWWGPMLLCSAQEICCLSRLFYITHFTAFTFARSPIYITFRVDKNRNTDAVQSKEYWIAGELDTNHLRVQLHFQPCPFPDKSVPWSSGRISEAISPSKASLLRGSEGYSLFIRIANSTMALLVSEEQNSPKEEEQQESSCWLRWAVLKGHSFASIFPVWTFAGTKGNR